MMVSPLCEISSKEKGLIERDLCFFMDTGDSVLVGRGMIITYARRGMVFNISENEWADIRIVLTKSKAMLDEQFQPYGYNVSLKQPKNRRPTKSDSAV